MQLPKELLDKILINLDFETIIKFGQYFDFIINKKYNEKKDFWNCAAENGHLEIVQWLHLNRKEGLFIFLN